MILSILYLLFYAAAGVLIGRYLFSTESFPHRLWLGLTLGLFGSIWLPSLFSFVLGFGTVSHILGAVLMAAEEVPGVYVIDSCCLSTGTGLLVCESGERVKKGMDAATIYEEVKALNQKNSASFILDTLAFLHAGGRCSSLAHMGANLMSIKPSIRVLNDKNGSMTVGKKYFGKLKKCIVAYIHDQLDGRTDIVRDRIFITHSGFPEADIEWMKEEVEKYGPWGEIIVTTAGCTISSHCGPGCIGVLFLTK